MPIEKNDLEKLLEDGFPGADIEVVALVNDNDHYKATIIAPQFVGKNRVQQHQMVYASLQGKMGGEIHALSLVTKPKE